MKRCLCLLLALFLLLPQALAETDWSGEDWAMTLAALSSDEENPVPRERRLAPPPGGRASNGEWLRILLLSTDTHHMKQNFGRTDVLLLCAVNLKTGETRLVSLPEDSQAAVPGLPEPVRLKYVNCFGGPLWALKVLETQLGLPIARYCAVNFSVFESIVDALGGVDMALEPTEREVLGLSEEALTLTGEQALRYVRMRRKDGDKGRPLRLLEAALGQALDRLSADEVLTLVDSLLPAIDTNLSANDLMSLAFAFCEPSAPGSISSMSLAASPDGALSPEEAQICRDFLTGKEIAP